MSKEFPDMTRKDLLAALGTVGVEVRGTTLVQDGTDTIRSLHGLGPRVPFAKVAQLCKVFGAPRPPVLGAGATS